MSAHVESHYPLFLSRNSDASPKTINIIFRMSDRGLPSSRLGEDRKFLVSCAELKTAPPESMETLLASIF